MSAGSSLSVTVWNEGIHEGLDTGGMGEYYPDGMHGAIAAFLRERLPGATVRTALMSDPGHGLGEEVLADTDVLLWWSHKGNADLDQDVAARVRAHVLSGMGLIVLHSAHLSKPFVGLMGTTCTLRWRNEGEREVMWTVAPSHPIAAGIPNPVVIPHQETYGEAFDVPAPEELVFISSFAGGEAFRSGMTYRRGKGRIFYFGPGDQLYPVFHQPEVQAILTNAVRWAAPEGEQRTLPGGSAAARGWFLPGDGD